MGSSVGRSVSTLARLSCALYLDLDEKAGDTFEKGTPGTKHALAGLKAGGSQSCLVWEAYMFHGKPVLDKEYCQQM